MTTIRKGNTELVHASLHKAKTVKKYDSYSFIRKSAIPGAMVGLLNALPDTQLWKRLEREGRLLGEASGNNTACTFNFQTRMDPAVLIQGYQTIMRTIYSPPEYYQRALDSMKRTAQEFSEPQHYDLLSSLSSLTRVLLKLGVFDGERKGILALRQ